MTTPKQRKKGGDDDNGSGGTGNQNDDPAIPGEPHHSDDGLASVTGEQAIPNSELGG